MDADRPSCSEWYQVVVEGAKKYMTNWITTHLSVTNARHAREHFAVLTLEFPSPVSIGGCRDVTNSPPRSILAISENVFRGYLRMLIDSSVVSVNSSVVRFSLFYSRIRLSTSFTLSADLIYLFNHNSD